MTPPIHPTGDPLSGWIQWIQELIETSATGLFAALAVYLIWKLVGWHEQDRKLFRRRLGVLPEDEEK